MKIRASGEDYLEAILISRTKNGVAPRSVDLARHMGYSKPSISHAVSTLKGSGFLTVDEEGCLQLTEAGLDVAERTYEKHCYFTEHPIQAGVDPVKAEEEACRMEHTISDDSFRKLKESAGQENFNP